MNQETGFPEQTALLAALDAAATEEAGNAEMIDVINALLNSRVVFASAEKAGDDGAVSPLMLQDTNGNPVMPLFTDPTLIPDDFMEQAPHASVVPGSAVIQSIVDAGIVLDVGSERQFGLSQEQLALVREEIQSNLDSPEV